MPVALSAKTVLNVPGCAREDNGGAFVNQAGALCAGRAVALLQRAVAVGYQDRAHMGKDSDLAPLRQRADFQKVLQSLPGKSAP